MSTLLTTERLPRPLQRLVDAHLDTIDRMLLGRVPRADRLGIVREVEGQIYDQLRERPGHELDREDVLTVLTQLDPPEAYIPEEAGYEPMAVVLPAPRVRTRRAEDPGERQRALVVGILGLLVMGMFCVAVLAYVLAVLGALGESVIYALFALALLMTAIGLPTLILSILWRRGGSWAIVGIVGGAMGLVVGPLTGFITLLN